MPGPGEEAPSAVVIERLVPSSGIGVAIRATHSAGRHVVAIALPLDEAVDTAHAVGDARGVVGVPGQGHERGLLEGEAIERGAAIAAAPPHVDDLVVPYGELGAHVVEVAEGAAVEKRSLELPEASLDARLGVGVAAHGARPELVVGREGEKARVVDGLLPLPSEHHWFLAVVDAAVGAALEAGEGLRVAVHERVEVSQPVEVEEFAPGVDEYIGEGLHDLLVAVGEGDFNRVGRPVALGHLAGAVRRG